MVFDSLAQYYRCPKRFSRFACKEPLSANDGFFQFGDRATYYGKCYGYEPEQLPEQCSRDLENDCEIKDGITYLPFDPSAVVDNLRLEIYVNNWRLEKPVSALADIYYIIRPILPVGVRSRLQKLYLRNWKSLKFPHWPVDTSIDELFQRLLLLSIKSNGVEKVPFIWFWPDGASSCSIVTHDVETNIGRDLCTTLMDIDDAFGVKASFQIVPEERYRVDHEFLSSIRDRGFEVVVHDLNHDGHLYRTQEQFLERTAKINAYGKQYGSDGFRAGVLYRKQVWYDALDFAYDMSVPNVAHLDPQRGGCCTVMPFFIGNILELPVTTTQDYTLFNIFNDYSIDLWKWQIDLIMEKHGLISLIVHPDYIMKPRELKVYHALLDHLSRLRQEKRVWITIPGEVNRWWRQRAAMRLVENGQGWQIEGMGKERACIAYASQEGGQLIFTVESSSGTKLAL